MVKSNWKFLANFSAGFTDLSEYSFQLPINDDPIYLESSFSRNLAPYKTLDNFTICISDSDEYNEGSLIVRLDPIFFRWIFDYPFEPDDLSNTGLLAMLVPIAIIFVPSLAVSGYITEAGDKEMGKMSFLPFCCLFSVIFGITGLVPIWVMFTLILLTIAYFFIRSRRDV
jgi:hypothetical protein